MSFKQLPRLSFVLIAAVLGAAAHADPGKTREQVRAETLAAIEHGDVGMGESGLTLREMFPGRYPAGPFVAGKTRSEVKAELAQAQRSGEMLADGLADLTLREEFPARYPAPRAVVGKTRAEVVAELRDAIRTGAMLADDQSGLTLREEFPQRYSRQ